MLFIWGVKEKNKGKGELFTLYLFVLGSAMNNMLPSLFAELCILFTLLILDSRIICTSLLVGVLQSKIELGKLQIL